MRTILISICIFTFAAFPVPRTGAQDAAAQQQIDQLNGRIQDVYGVMERQSKRIDALEKQVSSLQDKLNQPAAENSASADDLKKLAEQVQQIDKKRQDDNEQILKTLDKLSKSMGLPASGHKPVSAVSTTNSIPTAGGNTQKGYYYEVKSGDTLSAIAKAYREQGIKVTKDQIQTANPGLNPKNLTVGKKIFIPDPNAK
jgi:ABC-type transporter Mla subunit MlaD